MANQKRDFDYQKETVYGVGGGRPYENVTTGDGNPVYEPQLYTQSQLNNNMSGTDANAIYQATHDPNYAAQYSQPYMQNFLADLNNMGLTPYRGQYNPDDNASFVSGQGAYMMPSVMGTRQVLPQGVGSFADGGVSGWNMPQTDEAMAAYYAQILNAIRSNPNTPNINAPRIQEEMDWARMGVR